MGHKASARCKDRRLIPGNDLFQRVPLEPPVVALAMDLEDLAERETGGLFDAPVQLDEGNVHPPGERPSDGALPRSSEAKKSDQTRTLRGLEARWRKKLAGGGLESRGDLREAENGGVPLPRLHLREEPLGEPRAARQLLSTPSPRAAEAAHLSSDDREERVVAHDHSSIPIVSGFGEEPA